MSTPTTGRSALLGGALTLCQRMDASSLHVTFPDRRRMGMDGRAGHAAAPGPAVSLGSTRLRRTFDDFLAALSSNRRKTIRRERRDAQAGLEIVALTGDEITEDHWDAFFGFYMDTGSRKWGRPYLNRGSSRCWASGWPTRCS
jgi:predicted N-acyltransferase